MKHYLERSLLLPCSAATAFAWHEQPGTLAKLIPPSDPVTITEHQSGIQGPIGDGARVVMAVGYWPLRIRWVALHEAYVKNERFRDVQMHGPFASWRHTHLFRDEERGRSVMTDRVEYRLPMGALGDVLAHRAVRTRLSAMFAWRHHVTARELSGYKAAKR